MLKLILLLPFALLYAVATVLGLIMDLFLKPFIFTSTFLWSFVKEIAK